MAGTSVEFAKRIKCVVLHGPRAQQQEGASQETDSPHVQESLLNNMEGAFPAQTNRFLEYLTATSEGIDLLKVLAGRYDKDLFFKSILADPKHYKNF